MLLLERNSKNCVCHAFCHFYHVMFVETKTTLPYMFDGWTMDTYTTSKMVCRSYKQIV